MSTETKFVTHAPFGLAPFSLLPLIVMLVTFAPMLNACKSRGDVNESMKLAPTTVATHSAPRAASYRPAAIAPPVAAAKAVAAPASKAAGTPVTIRVRLNEWKGKPRFDIVANGEVNAVADTDSREPISLPRMAGEFSITTTATGLAIDGREISTTAVRLELADKAATFRLKVGESAPAIPVRGSLVIHRTDTGDLEIILVLDIEDYVRGSLLAEMPAEFGLEALKAQAVAIRTYGLYKIIENRQRGANARKFDVQDSVADLVYGGMPYEKPIGDTATRATRGEVLAYEGRLFPAFFHSTSGGATESAEHVFGTFKNLPPLRGGREGFSEASRFDAWTVRLNWAAVREKLIADGADPNKLGSSVREVRRYFFADANGTPAATEADPARRPEHFEFVTDRGNFKIQATRLRRVIGAGKTGMPSTACVIRPDGAELVVTGRGFGHGVGLCQYSAAEMARRGATHAQILAHFYPDSQLMRQ